jgi:hypothetical protein
VLKPTDKFSHRVVARICAAAIIRNGFSARRAMMELRPDLPPGGGQCISLSAKMMKTAAVQRAVEALMETPQHNIAKYVDLVWEWLLNEGTEVELASGKKAKVLSKADLELKLLAARILARQYISDKTPQGAPKPLNVDGLDSGLAALTGMPMPTEKKQ